MPQWRVYRNSCLIRLGEVYCRLELSEESAEEVFAADESALREELVRIGAVNCPTLELDDSGEIKGWGKGETVGAVVFGRDGVRTVFSRWNMEA